MHRTLGIERGVLVQNTLVQPDYDALLADLARHPSYRAVALIDDDTSYADLERLHRGGVRGVRFHFAAFMQHRVASLDVLLRSAARVAEFGWHVVFHLHAEQLLELDSVLLRFPTDVVIDHLGHVHYDEGLAQPAFQKLLELQRLDHIWIKIGNSDRWSRTGPPSYADSVPFGQAVVANGVDRLIWGSDWPHALYAGADGDRPPPDDGTLLDLLEAFAPDPTARRRILVDNPTRLYGAPG